MTSTQFGILSSFDHDVHTWNTYKGRLTQWFIANDITASSDPTGTKRRAILLSALSDGTYKLAADLALPKELQEVPYEDIVKLLDKHFIPKRCGFSERYNFYIAKQQSNETHAQWAARLRGLTAHCGFSNIEEALRDRFVMGMLPGPERDKLFAQDLADLTLSKAVEIADSLRCARAGAAATAAYSPTEQEQVFKIVRSQQNDKSDKCLVCGRSNHKSSQCRFANYKCKKCNKKGHLRRMCKNVNYIETEAVSEGDSDDGKLFNIRSKQGEPLTEIVSIKNVKLKFEIDSGSAVTVISEKTYKRYFSDTPLSLTNKRLFSYTGDDIECIGVARLPFAYSSRTHTLDVHVVRRGGPPLLGRDFISSFELQLLPCNFLKQADNNITEKLQSCYPKLFSNKLGAFNKYKVKLKLKENSKPIFFKARPVAFALREKIDKEIDRLVNLGILEPVEHSEYASPIVPVLKRDGSVRLCADYSVSINKQLVVEQYPLPTIHELFSKLHGGQQFSKLDLSMAYNQFLLDDTDESQNITCINTHRGLFKYTRMVFGLTSAPSIFQRAMENLLSNIDGVLCLLDDILITGNDPSQHLERLHIVLERLQDAGLTLQKDKCEFFKNEISYLGYVIDRTGLKKSPQKIKAITEAAVPTDVNKLQSFLGLVNYYRNFVPDASNILSPLYELLKKKTKWNWNAEHDNSFSKIKKILASDQVLTHFDPNAKLILTVDASPNGLGAILSQVASDGTERPISFASRTLNAAEKRYSQIQKEATAIIFGIRRFHQYLYGRSDPFILRTDHKPLISIFGSHRGIPEVSANRLQRYAMFMSAYNYKIEYIRSADNSADYLSRASLPEKIERAGSGAGRERCADAAAAAPIDRAAYVNFVVEGSLPVTLDDLRAETSNDIVLNTIINYILNGWPKKVTDIRMKPYFLCRFQMSYENGCIMRGHKVVIPEKLRLKVLSELHESHLGIVKTKAEARARFWFPGIDNTIEKMIGSCNICLQLRPTPPRTPPSPWEYPPRPFFRIHIDFLGPINRRVYLVIVDAYTKWVEAYDVNNTSTSVVIESLYEFMSRFGVPNTVVSDNGTAFTSQEFKLFCNLNGINHLTSPAYHPASNGQAESYVKVVKKGIKSCMLSGHNPRKCKLKLLKYLFDYRNSTHSATGFSPAELVYGKKLRTRLDLINPKPLPLSSDTPANNVKNKQCLQNKRYSSSKNKRCFTAGNSVLYKKFTNNGKFIWNRGIIIKKIGKVTYIIKDCATSTCIKKHVNQIILYKGVDNVLQTSDSDIVSQRRPSRETSSSVTEASPRHESSDNSRLSKGETTPSPPDSNLSKSPSPSTSSSLMDTRSSPANQEEFHDAIEGRDDVSERDDQVDPALVLNSPRKLRTVPKVNYKSFY